MHALQALAWLAGGATLTNAVPHLVCGLTGRPFQSPFATPRGVGLSSSTVNVLWGFGNLVLAYLLLVRSGAFDLRDPAAAALCGAGGLMMGLFCARHFGRFHGGRLDSRPAPDQRP